MKQPTIPKKMVRRSHVAVQWLMRFVAEVAPRPSGMGSNTIKTHLVLHLCENILNHGVPENVNSSYAESAHIPLAKTTAWNSQKRAGSFTKQAAHWYIENLALSLAWADVESDARQCHTNSREDEPETEEAVNGNSIHQFDPGREFHLVWKTGDKFPSCSWAHVCSGQIPRPPPVQDCLRPQNMGRLSEIPNGHRRRQRPVPLGTVLFDNLVATLPATANPPSTG